ncbi:MAG TPA: metal-dependent transcriptional regulator [Candidatus Hydrogenedentes bacterium]|nr:metal-dependent transcriptional regulator [Candidatus Hydrogenedentota bacterium]HOL76177.1 metal-dependent transcriptional regulator [Candidatus Hydrogenedentota bacterium]HPO84792.1 metal-dependent transcriptional regulator [Candidatus Hydrogenedentota bacterium]
MSEKATERACWRDVQKNDITHSAAHYLMAIDTLREQNGYARVTDVAELLEVTRGAASISIAQLKKREWVTEDKHRFLVLTEEGKHMAMLVEQNFRTLSRFFEEVLGVSREVALAEACKMEHLMSLETGKRLVWLMKYILSHGHTAAEIHQAMNCFKPGCESVEHCPLCEDDSVPPSRYGVLADSGNSESGMAQGDRCE